jgi:antirestriction protein ArdC
MDLYQSVTDRIVSMIERGAGDWRMPWHAAASGDISMPHNVTGRAYRGVNVPLLWASAQAFGYGSPVWATYKQWQERGAQVRRGEKSTLIIFWKRIEVAANDNDDGDDPTDPTETRLIARGYSVFSAAQVDGFDPQTVARKGELIEASRIEQVERYFRNTGSIVRHGGARAFYSPGGDFIQMPEFRQFVAADRYYSTLAHEHVHWTGAVQRCAREFGRRFGDNAYAFEELVAELGAAFLCAELGLSNEPRQDHAAYLAGWLRVLKGDKRAIFTAASKAQAAADFLNRLQSAAMPLAA